MQRVAPRGRIVGLVMVTLGAGLSEGAGLLLLLPLLELMTSGAAASAGTLSAQRMSSATQQVLFLARWLGLGTGPVGLLAGFVALVSLASVLQYARTTMAASVLQACVDELRSDCYEALLRADYRWLIQRRRSDHLQMLLMDINRIGAGVNAGITLAAMGASAAVYLALSSGLSHGLTLAALLSGGVLWLLLARQRREAYVLGQAFGAAHRAVQAEAQDGLAGVKLTKMLSAEANEAARFSSATEALRAQQMGFVRSGGRARLSLQVLSAAVLAGFIYLGLAVWHTPLPVVLTLVVLLGRLLPMFASAQQQAQQWFNALPALESVNALLKDCADVAEPGVLALPNRNWSGDIVLNSVTVLRGEYLPPALRNVSLRLEAGSINALTGASGAGKSTLADVLAGLLVPDDGEMHVGAVHLSGADRMLWRQSVAYVTQEVFLTHDTVRANLLWGGKSATDAELRQVLRTAAADFVLTLPAGLDTVIGEAGLALSGGERQRLALARALLRRPALLILDESTSALDSENERHVLRAVHALRSQLTVLLIGHRPAALQLADQVLLLESGSLIPMSLVC